MRKFKIIIFISSLMAGILFFIISLFLTPPQTDNEPINVESTVSETSPSDMSKYAGLVPSLTDGYSAFVGPWAYVFYAKDPATGFTYHDADDGYVPQKGDLLITGDEYDEVFISRRDLRRITGLGRFDYWDSDYAWNGHILYIADNNNGILTCYEGNTIAPGQDLDPDDDDYILLSSIDCIEIDFKSSTVLTENKTQGKTVRAVIETGFPEDLSSAMNYYASQLLNDFNKDPFRVRSEIMSLYPADIDWCGLFIHYLMLGTVGETS